MSKIEESNLSLADFSYMREALRTVDEFFRLRRSGLKTYDNGKIESYSVSELTDRGHSHDEVRVSGTLVRIHDRDSQEREFLILYTNSIDQEGLDRMAEFVEEALKTHDIDKTHICASYYGSAEKVPHHLDIGFDLVTFDAKEYEDKVYDGSWIAVWPKGYMKDARVYLDDRHEKLLEQVMAEKHLGKTQAILYLLERYTPENTLYYGKRVPDRRTGRSADTIRYYKVDTTFEDEPLLFISDHAPTPPELVEFFAEYFDIYMKGEPVSKPTTKDYGEIEEIAPEEIAGSQEYLTANWFNLAKAAQLYYYYVVLETDDPYYEKRLELVFRSMYRDPPTAYVKTPFWGYITGDDPYAYGCRYKVKGIEPFTCSYESYKNDALPMVFELPISDEDWREMQLSRLGYLA